MENVTISKSVFPAIIALLAACKPPVQSDTSSLKQQGSSKEIRTYVPSGEKGNVQCWYAGFPATSSVDRLTPNAITVAEVKALLEKKATEADNRSMISLWVTGGGIGMLIGGLAAGDCILGTKIGCIVAGAFLAGTGGYAATTNDSSSREQKNVAEHGVGNAATQEVAYEIPKEVFQELVAEIPKLNNSGRIPCEKADAKFVQDLYAKQVKITEKL